MRNSLPQGSVLVLIFFKIYDLDKYKTTSEKFIYPDDIVILTQAKSFEVLENTFIKDLMKLKSHFKHWVLNLDVNKTVPFCFHLNKRQVNAELKVLFCIITLKQEHYTKVSMREALLLTNIQITP